MKAILAGLVALVMLAVPVLATPVQWNSPVFPGPMPLPTLPQSLPDTQIVQNLQNGQIEHNLNAMGGWYYNNGWSLQDLQHITANLYMNSQAAGTQNYQADYMPSGTEAQGTAWKLAAQTSLTTTGTARIFDQLSAWTVNPVPPASGYTQFHYYEQTGATGGNTHSTLNVNGFAQGNEGSSTFVVSDFNTANPTTQFKLVTVN